ncbi:MAG TPA: hypothetical protein VH306_03970 [Gaiellaceae bacterium]
MALGGNPAVIDQYQEQVPSADGSGGRGAPPGGDQTSPAVDQAMSGAVGGSTASQLEALVNSTPAPAKKHTKHDSGPIKSAASSGGSTDGNLAGNLVSGAMGSTSDGDGRYLLAILLGAVAVVLAASAAVFGRRRGRGRPGI